MFNLSTIQTKLLELVAVAVILCVCYYFVFNQGASHEHNKMVAEQAVATQQLQNKYNDVAAKYEETKNGRKANGEVVTKVVKQIVTRNVYRNVCIDDDGLRVANEALKGYRSSSSSNATVLSSEIY